VRGQVSHTYENSHVSTLLVFILTRVLHKTVKDLSLFTRMSDYILHSSYITVHALKLETATSVIRSEGRV
jgi:hypothetical protein